MPSISYVREIQTPLAINESGQPFFDLTIDTDPKGVTCISDPLAINGETLIGQSRKDRPVPKMDTSSTPIKNCPFCERNEERSEESGHVPLDPAYSVANPYPFGPRIHEVIYTGAAKHDLYDLYADDICAFYGELHRIAVEGREKHGEELDGLSYGMNCGHYLACGASQPHLHSQVAGLLKKSFNAGDQIACMYHAWREKYSGRNFLDDYSTALRSPIPLDAGSQEEGGEGSLIIAENEHAILYVPIAQHYRLEMQVMLKAPCVSNILKTTPEIRRGIAELEATALTAYRLQGINSLNTLLYAGRFSQADDVDQRIIVSICPRTSVFAWAEMLGRFVIDEFPWQCAEKFRASLDAWAARSERTIECIRLPNQ
jgi:galactose-1-phosphate uridylyltransferase